MDPQSPVASFGAPEGLFIVAIIAFYGLMFLSAIVGLIASWKIIGKTGNAGALALLMFVPLGNLFLILWLAFSEWPIEKELANLRARDRGQTANGNTW